MICAAQKSTEYKIQYFTDKNGYTYQKVTNDPINLRIYKLKNGLTVYLARDTIEPVIVYAAAIRAGSAYDPITNTGLAHYLEHLLFNGTNKIGALNWKEEKPLLDKIEALYEKRKATSDTIKKKMLFSQIDSLSLLSSNYAIKNEYRKLVADLGGTSVNGVTDFEKSVLGCVVSSVSLDKLLLIEKDRFSNPAFRAFTTELEIVYEEYNRLQDIDFTQKYFAANRALFPNHPYGQSATSQHLKNPSVRSVRSYFNQFYVPGNMAVILVGDLDFDRTILKVDQTLGSIPSSEVQRPIFPKESAMQKAVTLTLTSPSAPSVFFAFRLPGAGSKDQKYLMLFDKMLTNSTAGLLNVELTSKQKAGNAYSTTVVNNDYSMHYINVNARSGQELSDLRDSVIAMLDRFKAGDFPEWMIKAAGQELKQEFLKEMTDNRNLDAVCVSEFTRFLSRKQTLDLYGNIELTKKQEIMDFIKRNYQNNYVVVCKKQGNSIEFAKVTKPLISPIHSNSDKRSPFAEKLERLKIPAMKPRFVDYSSSIQHKTLLNGLNVAMVDNSRNEIFQIHFIFPSGTASDKRILPAVGYLNYCTSAGNSALEWKKQFFKAGVRFSSTVHNDRTIFSLEGLNKNMAAGIELLDKWLNNLVGDSNTYQNYLKITINRRTSNLSDRTSIREALVNYAIYKDNSPFRNIYTDQELKTLDPKMLVNVVKGLLHKRHSIFYYGSTQKEAQSVLEKFYHDPLDLSSIDPVKSAPITPSPSIYFVDYPGTQAEIVVFARGGVPSPHSIAPSMVFNRIMDKLSFQEIRERRSLAYTSWAVTVIPEGSPDYVHTEVYAAVQTDKLPDILDVAVKLMTDFSQAEQFFESAKADLLKRFERERIFGPQLFWSFDNWLKKGIDYDYRRDIYEQVKKMQFEDVKRYFAQHIANRNLTIVIIGYKSRLDYTVFNKYGEFKEISRKDIFNY